MKKYLVLLWHIRGCKEFTILSSIYPMHDKIVSSSGINASDIIDYQVNY